MPISKQTFLKELSSLNPSQRKAVDAIEGPVMVIAGPGTGKTRTLTVRIANILAKTDTKAENILALTFTESAATNMKNKLLQLIGQDAYKIKCTTFHSFCNDIIQSHPEKFQTNIKFKQILDIEKHTIIEKIIDETKLEYLTNFNTPYFYKKDIINSIATLKREAITPKKFKKIVKKEKEEILSMVKINPRTNKLRNKDQNLIKNNEKNKELAIIYQKYQDYLRENGLYDYEDMILNVVNKMEKDDGLLAELQEKYLYILIDEFQDTNGGQFKIIELLGSFDKNPNIFVVGDDDQSIFRFQGANLENMLDFIKTYPNTKIINLDITYRLPQAHITSARELIKNNKTNLDKYIKDFTKSIKTTNKYKTKIKIFELETIEDENIFISKKIIDLIKNQNVNPNEIAVIFRNNKDADEIIKFLKLNNIKTNLVVGDYILYDKFIQQFIQVLKIISQDENIDNELLFEILNYKFWNLNRLEVFKIANESSLHQTPIFNFMLETLENDSLKDKYKDITKFTQQLLDLKQKRFNMHFVQFVETILNESNLLNYLIKNKETKSISSFIDLFKFIKNRSLNIEDYNIKNFLNDIEKLMENEIKIDLSYNNEQTGVNFMTVHKAKGLEFSYVFLINLRDKKWGNIRSQKKIKLPHQIFDRINTDELNPNEEERRVLFVAMTRSKKELYMTFPKQKIEEGRITNYIKSQFIQELPPNNIIYKQMSINEEEKTNYEQLSLKLLDKNNPIELEKQEKQWLLNLVKNFRLNVTALNNFLEDPEKFLYYNLIRIPQTKTPQLVIGTIIHSVLEQFGRDLIKQDLQKFDYYINLIPILLKREFISHKKKKEIQQECAKIIKPFLEEQFSKKAKILKVEYKFPRTIYLDDIPLAGKIDRIEQIDLKKVSILPSAKLIDFKTGTPKSRNAILGKTKNSDKKTLRQLQFYKLLVTLYGNLPYNITEYSIKFVKPNKNNKLIEHIFSSSEIEIDEIIDAIRFAMNKIRNLDFSLQENF